MIYFSIALIMLSLISGLISGDMKSKQCERSHLSVNFCFLCSYFGKISCLMYKLMRSCYSMRLNSFCKVKFGLELSNMKPLSNNSSITLIFCVSPKSSDLRSYSLYIGFPFKLSTCKTWFFVNKSEIHVIFDKLLWLKSSNLRFLWSRVYFKISLACIFMVILMRRNSRRFFNTRMSAISYVIDVSPISQSLRVSYFI